MKSFRVIGPGWGYPIVFLALTVPAVLGSLQQPDGGGRALVVVAVTALLLFGWWRRGVWLANDTYLVVVNWVRRTVIKAEGTELELVPLGSADVSVDDFDPRRVKTLRLIAADGTSVRVRVVDGASGMRVRRSVEALRVLLRSFDEPEAAA